MPNGQNTRKRLSTIKHHINLKKFQIFIFLSQPQPAENPSKGWVESTACKKSVQGYLYIPICSFLPFEFQKVGGGEGKLGNTVQPQLKLKYCKDP